MFSGFVIFKGVWSLGFIFLSLIFILSFISCLFVGCFGFFCVLSFIFCEMHKGVGDYF
ncbi:membrane protein [Helicobacter pylori UM037]|nr:membrane protein [Helicobacter pylori UM037]KNE05226.1 membrane protein [Helicobacter pylori]